MCGRYSLALRPGQIRQHFEDNNMPVYHGIPDNNDDSDAPSPGAPRQSYNFAPGYHGVVYRAEVPDWGAGPHHRGGRSHGDAGAEHEEGHEDEYDTEKAPSPSEIHNGGDNGKEVKYILQSMKWGLIPFWTKRNPDYGSMLKTINCRDDSLAQSGGMWASMKARKRCIVVAQGFYEWLKKDGVKDKIPHYIKRKDGKLLCMAGLWDVVQYDDDEYKNYTYTIITTSSNAQLSFLHDRMPVILENGSDQIRTWLDPSRHEWTTELQALLQPWKGELEIYPVSKDVGKVGNNSPTFIVPIDSRENKNNIANFFTSKTGNNKKEMSNAGGGRKKEEVVKKENDLVGTPEKKKSIKTEYMSQPEIKVASDKGFIAEDEDNPQATPIKQEPSSQSAATTTTTPLKRHASNSGEPPLKKEKLADNEPSPAATEDGSSNPRTLSKRSNASSAPPQTQSSPTKQHRHQQQSATKSLAGTTGRPRISATTNGTKLPNKKSGKNPGAQKITKFFGNSA